MTVPQTFRKSRENAFVNYNYSDIAEGTGTTELNFFVSSTSSGAYTTNMSANNVYSTMAGPASPTAITSIEPTFDKAGSWDFKQSPYNLPRTIRGDCKISIPVGAFSTDGSQTVKFYVSGALIKESGGSDTLLASGSSDIISVSNSGTSIDLFSIDLGNVTRTKMKKGDILKVNVSVYGTITAGSNSGGYLVIGSSPNNVQTSGAFSTDNIDILGTKVYVPYELIL